MENSRDLLTLAEKQRCVLYQKMKHKILFSIFCILAMAAEANAQSLEKHSVGASWSYYGFNSTYSKNSDKRTFGTFGLNYGYRFNKWISVNGNLGWSHSWLREGANTAYAYPLKDNAILILAGCDVSWFRKGLLQLHSGISGGVDIRVQKNYRGSYTTVAFAGQLDVIGLKLDWKHAYVDMSAGWGSMGCIRLGAGYKF